MLARTPGLLVALLLGIVVGCAKPDSVEIGGVCKEQVECKDPADTCLTVGTESRCSKACAKGDQCPEGFVCAKMDVAVQASGKTTQTSKGGYCLPKSEVPSHAVTL